MTAFNWSKIQPAESLEESRAYRFNHERLPLLMNYLGLEPGMQVLEVGCGPGTFAPFLAEGVAPGSVTGLDLDAGFIERAREKAQNQGIENLEYIVGSAYELPFANDSFDAVTSYTGIGVLNDPEKAMAEMIRVCRPGGTISVIEAITGVNGIRFDGLDSVPEVETYPGAQRYQELRRKIMQWSSQQPAREKLGSSKWPIRSFFALLGQFGLNNLQFNAWGYGTAADDQRVAVELRHQQQTAQFEEEKRWLEVQRENPEFLALTTDEVEEMIMLAEVRHQYRLENALYEWEAGISVVVSGVKPYLAE